MLNSSRRFFPAMAAAALCMLPIGASMAQDNEQYNIRQPGDPARWFQEQPTPQDYYMTLKKEAGAAYGLAIDDCRHGASSLRASCMRQARSTYTQDLIDAKAKSLGE